MKRSSIVWIVVIIIIILAIVGIAWMSTGSGSSSPAASTPAAQTTAVSASTQAPAATVNSPAATPFVLATAVSPSLGSYLSATNGMTLYVDTKDAVGASVCYSSCAAAWPPYIVSSTAAPLEGGSGVTGTIGTITRTDGTFQVTYKGKPLYFWQGDAKVGDTTGQSVGTFLIAQP